MRPWLKNKFIFSLIFLLMGYYAIRCRKYEYTFTSTVHQSTPKDVFEYVSDFSNMKKLIPTIIDFNIESETGNGDDWRYKVYYREYLSQASYFTNFAWADYRAKKLSEDKYAVFSNHQTCFLLSSLCLYTESVFLISRIKNTPDTTYTEAIIYECPAIFKPFCEQEIAYQRNEISKVLNEVFAEHS